jgi:hypothetical protein
MGASAGGQPAPASGGKGGGNAFQQASQAMTGAYGGAGGAMMYQPMMVGSGGAMGRGFGGMAGGGGARASSVDPSSADYQAAQFQQADLDRFMNPYTGQVIDQSLADIERARLQQANQAAAQATAAGAFGGSRGALMEAEIARNALEQGAGTAAGLRRQGFEFASQMGQQDVARRQQALAQNAQQQLQAMLANQASALAASQTNAQLGTQSSIANQQAALQAALANQAAGLQGSQQSLQAALGLGNLANLGFGMGQDVLGGMQQQGLMQQMLNQQILDRASGQYAGYQGQPSQALGYLAQALGATSVPQSQTTSSDPGLFGWASMLLGSDVRLKKNIRRVGKTPGGHNLYAWDWKKQAKFVFGKTGSDMGVLAQEVKETRPDLVIEFPDGYYRVNYGGIA